MRYPTILLAVGSLVAAAFSTEAWAQEAEDVARPVAQTATAPAVAAKSGARPIAYLIDNSGKLGTVDLGTRAVHVISGTRLHLTDIAFSPDHKLYGLTFKNFYRVDPATAHATFVGKLSPNGINALVFDKNGQGYAAAYNSMNLYRVDAATGRATVIGPNGRYMSAGDLAFFKGLLLTTADENIMALNPATGAAKAVKHDGIKELFGLASPSPSEIDLQHVAAADHELPLCRQGPRQNPGRGRRRQLGAVARGGHHRSRQRTLPTASSSSWSAARASRATRNARRKLSRRSSSEAF